MCALYMYNVHTVTLHTVEPHSATISELRLPCNKEHFSAIPESPFSIHFTVPYN